MTLPRHEHERYCTRCGYHWIYVPPAKLSRIWTSFATAVAVAIIALAFPIVLPVALIFALWDFHRGKKQTPSCPACEGEDCSIDAALPRAREAIGFPGRRVNPG